MQHPVVSRERVAGRAQGAACEGKRRNPIARQGRRRPSGAALGQGRKGLCFRHAGRRKAPSDLFAGRSQLIVYHFMLGPGWKAGCPSCSFLGDHVDGALAHLNHHDVTWIAVARAPMNEIAAYKTRMGWKFPWVSSFGSSFNHDFGVSFSKEELAKGEVDYNFRKIPAANANDELPGLSAFYRNDKGEIFHTYSSYARGAEELIGTLMILDRAPLGRNESGTMNFVRRHDEYDQPIKAAE